MNTIKWVNDTFCPWGMHPIEDLPEAVPGQGNSCVLAKVLKDGFPDLQDVHVGSTSIDFNIADPYRDVSDWITDKRLAEHLFPDGHLEDVMYFPQHISDFIRDFDNGSIRELIDEELTIANLGEWEAHNSFKIGCAGDDCPFCKGDND